MSRQIDLSPSPSSLIQSLRDIGYSLETAIADIIDNSITANSKQIDIRFSFNDGEPWLAIVDDGTGMTAPELREAMRFGSKNPLDTRPADDLGRFGLGMKTASLSQCLNLTVMSKKASRISCCQWDLERIAHENRSGWMLEVLNKGDIQTRPTLRGLQSEYLNGKKSGTIVLWENFDRVEKQGNKKKDEAHFNDLVILAREHLELVFHRYLSPDPGEKKKIVISMNEDPLEAFNPFNPTNNATQELNQQQIVVRGKRITVQPYVLPHHNKVSRSEYERYAGKEGYLENQGFYVYRNKRLIIKGTWFRLLKKEELNKLIRVRVDIPNTLDQLWKIDVKKSRAALPAAIRNELKKVINKIELAGKRVYRQRGSKLASKIESPIWDRVAAGRKIEYRINREHPLIIELGKGESKDRRLLLEQTVAAIESSFPRDLYFQDIASIPESVKSPTISEPDLKKLIELFVELWGEDEDNKGDIGKRLLLTEPFHSNSKQTGKLLKKMGYLE